MIGDPPYNPYPQWPWYTPWPVYPQPYTAPNMGWQCPKCGRGNAPFVHQCPCGPAYTTTLGSGTGSDSTAARDGDQK